MKKVLSLLAIILCAHLDVKAQTIDTIKVESTINKVVSALKEKSFESFKKLLLDKKHYLDLARKVHGNHPDIKEGAELDKAFAALSSRIEEYYQQVLEKGEEKGIVWADIKFEGYVSDSEEVGIGNEILPQGAIVDSHIRLSYNGKKYTVIGIELWLYNNEYKVNGDAIRGIFEMDLDVYVPADNMYLDEMEIEKYEEK